MGANTEIARLDLVEKDKINAILNAQTLPNTTSNDNDKVLMVSSGKWAKKALTKELPAVTGGDNGKVLTVSEGAWAAGSLPVELPAVTATDNGKVLMVVEGQWAVASLPTTEETTGD